MSKTITWPTSQPRPTVQGHSLQPGDNIIRTEMDSGIARQRRRFTDVPDKLSVRWVMSNDQYTLFESWYRWHTQSGTAWFSVPIQGTKLRQARFIGRWLARPLSRGMRWEITSTLEVRSEPSISEAMLNLLLNTNPQGIIKAGKELHTLVESR